MITSSEQGSRCSCTRWSHFRQLDRLIRGGLTSKSRLMEAWPLMSRCRGDSISICISSTKGDKRQRMMLNYFKQEIDSNLQRRCKEKLWRHSTRGHQRLSWGNRSFRRSKISPEGRRASWECWRYSYRSSKLIRRLRYRRSSSSIRWSWKKQIRGNITKGRLCWIEFDSDWGRRQIEQRGGSHRRRMLRPHRTTELSCH